KAATSCVTAFSLLREAAGRAAVYTLPVRGVRADRTWAKRAKARITTRPAEAAERRATAGPAARARIALKTDLREVWVTAAAAVTKEFIITVIARTIVVPPARAEAAAAVITAVAAARAASISIATAIRAPAAVAVRRMSNQARPKRIFGAVGKTQRVMVSSFLAGSE